LIRFFNACSLTIWQPKSGSPTLFAPSLNVQGDDVHDNSGFSVWRAGSPTAFRSRASSAGRKCVLNMGRGDFPPVLKSDHTGDGSVRTFLAGGALVRINRNSLQGVNGRLTS
jgi:hypothetical protein